LVLPAECKEIEWRRSVDLEPAPETMNNGDRLASGIKQSSVGPVDTFVTSILQNQFGSEKLDKLFCSDELSVTGYYKLEIPTFNGKPVTVEIDDLVPCIDGEPCYVTLATGDGLWPVLLRKAVAKLWGGYDALPQGFEFGLIIPLPDTKTLIEPLITSLQITFGSPSNPVRLPSAGALAKAAMTTVLPLASYAEGGGKTLWHGWLPQTPFFRLTGETLKVSLGKSANRFVVVILLSCPGERKEWQPAEKAAWEHAGLYNSQEKPFKQFVLDPALLYVCAAFECDALGGLWGVRPANWHSIEFLIT